MADLGILLKDDLALAAFEGRKTVSRRPISPQPEPATAHPKCRATWSELLTTDGPMWRFYWHTPTSQGEKVDWGEIHAPVIRGAGTAKVGGRAWIRECFSPHYHGIRQPAYRADYSDSIRDVVPEPKWRPSIHMPKWACRTWGRITSVTPCDLSTVDDAEAEREGFETANELKAALRSLYPTARWFWRIEWDRIETPEAPNA